MSIRIYALAKQLKVENKLLVETCKTLGITGKGSALASLSDEQVAMIKTYLSGGQKKTKSAAEPIGPQRTRKVVGRVPVLPSKSKSAASPSLSVPAPPETSPQAPSTPVSREDYVAPAGAPPKKIPLLGKLERLGKKLLKSDTSKKPPSDESQRGTEPPEKSGPAIKLAPMPAAKQPAPKKKGKEPAPQKPDLRLPPDAIRASKAGTKPLSEHLRKHEKKRKAAAKKAPSAGPAPDDLKTRAPPPGAGKDRGQRAGRAAVAPQDDQGPKLGGREQRQLKRKRVAAGRRRRSGDDEDVTPRPVRRLKRTGHASTAAPRKSNVVLQLPCTVKSFAETLGLPVADVQKKSLELGTMLTITSSLDAEAAELLAEALDAKVDFRQELSLEEKFLLASQQQEEAPETLKPRAPVVTFLGHVDHGKTSLLDRIINIDVVSTEKGGITQHIRAYRIEKNGKAIAFVDTPGHEAFTAMRARGANCTDIAVLVVAADDGVMPQTEEAISHARAADVPIVVALNKIDLPGVNLDRALQELAANELLPSQWGGDTEVVRTSAVTGEGIDELLDTLLTVAELHEYKANPDRPATGICLEAEVQQGRGAVCKILVEKGTLRVGDVIVCGAAHGRIKAMYDTLNPRKRHKEAGPSTPVNLTGLDVAPGAGDRFHVLEDITQARQIAEGRAARSRQVELSGSETHITLENLFERLGEKDEVQSLNIILRADVRGSIEAIRKELTKLEHPEVQIKILQATVGGITEADVYLADASDAIIIGFNVVPDEGARILADQKRVQIRRYDVIYQVTEDLKASLEGMLKPEKREVELGRALVQRTFTISRVGTVAGCRVLSGTIERNSRVRVIRDSRVIGDYPLDSLRREKDDVREAREGFECGMKLSGFNDVKQGDILETYKIEEVGRTFDQFDPSQLKV